MARALRLGFPAQRIEAIGSLKARPSSVAPAGMTGSRVVIPGERSETRDPGTPNLQRFIRGRRKRWAQVVGEALPLTHDLRIVRGVMLKGAFTLAAMGVAV